MMSSLVGHMGQRGASAYCATKGGIHALTRAIAVDEAPYGVRCNSISPGNIMTPLFEEWLTTTKGDALKKMERLQHIKRLGTAEECGKLALFLACDSDYITGRDHIISGGSELDYGDKFTLSEEEQKLL